MTTKQTWRLVVCIDVEAPTLEAAYEKVNRTMTAIVPAVEWESTDEAFDPNGEQIDEEVLSQARMRVFNLLNEQTPDPGNL